MARRIENPLTTGLPSKIYLLCYLDRESGYSLAQKIYPDKKYMATSKIYGWTKKLVEGGYLDRFKEQDRFAARIEPLVEMISNSITESDNRYFTPSSERLNQKEKEAVASLLNSDVFKRTVELSVIKTERTDGTTKVLRSPDEEINAFREIAYTLGFFCAITYVIRNTEKKLPLLEEKLPYYQPPHWEEDARRHNELIRLLTKFPDSLLNKLSRLLPMWGSIASNLLYDEWAQQNKTKVNKR